MKTFSGQRLKVGKLLIDFVLKSHDVSKWFSLSEELESIVLKLDQSLGSKLAKLAEIVLCIGAKNTAKFRMCYELLNEWEVIGGYWWVVQEELLRHAALHSIKPSSFLTLKPSAYTHELRGSFTEVLPHPTLISHPMLREKVRLLGDEMETLVVSMAHSSHPQAILQEYSDQFPLAKFCEWSTNWGKELLKNASVMCPDVTHFTESGDIEITDASSPTLKVTTGVQTDLVEAVLETYTLERPTDMLLLEDNFIADTAGEAYEVVSSVKVNETATSLTSVSRRRTSHSETDSLSSDHTVEMIAFRDDVPEMTITQLTEEQLQESKIDSVLKFLSQTVGSLMHKFEPQTVESTVDTTAGSTMTSETEAEEEGHCEK